MSKIALMIAAVFLLLAPLAAGTITVTAPNGGERLVPGNLFQITWTTSGITQDVRIVLIRPAGGRVGVIAEGLAPGSSPCRWTVGETTSGDAAEGEYRIRVITADGETLDESNANFTIAAASGPPPTRSLTITSPRAGGFYVEGSRQEITWTSSGLDDIVHIYMTRASYDGDALVGLRVVDVADGRIDWQPSTLGEAPPAGVWEVADYRIVMLCGGIRAESGSFGVSRVPHCDLVISDPYLEQRSSGKGFRVKVTDLEGDFNGWVIIQHYCMGMGLGNAVKERRRLELRRGVPATVNLANVRGSLFDGKCDVTFRFDVNPDREVAESNYDNNVTSKKFCWESGHDGRFFSLRVGRNYTEACRECSVVIRPGDVESVDGETVQVRLEITVQNCGNTAIRGARVLTNFSWYFRDAGNRIQEGGTNLDLVEGIDMEPGHFRILNRTVRMRRYPGSSLRIYLESDETGTLNANNSFTCHPNFVGF